MKNIILTSLLSIVSFSSFSYSDQWSGKEKSDFIFQKLKDTQYIDLPSYEKTDVLGLLSNLWSFEKKELTTDIIDTPYIKGIHRRSSVAKVKFVPSFKNYRESILGGFDFGILRVSLTESPQSGLYKPGLALKVLIDGRKSANVSMLVNLDGYSNSNIFSETFSNIVPKPVTTKGKLGVALFRLRSKYPRAIKLDEFSKVSQTGEIINDEGIIKQVYFVPVERLKNDGNLNGDPRFYMETLLSPGETLFHVYGRANGGYEYSKHGTNSEYLGDLIIDSHFISSSFGDDQLFFNHEFVD